ncbi:serine protease [Mucilaginibacter sp.]|uniref:S1 family peptidase n=1 Tax=Mucilaginibacter sp. TaxID=1882438 RepID=UPI002ED075BF
MTVFYFLKNKIGRGLIAPLLILISSATSYAQNAQEDPFVDYNELLSNVQANLKIAQAKKAFLTSAILREQTLKLPTGSKAVVASSSLASSGTRDLSAPELVNSRKDGVLMICKYYKASEGQPDRIQMHATATVLTPDGICVSNWHVFMAMEQPEMQLPAADSLTFAVSLKGNIYPIERIMAFNEKCDVAIFKINASGQQLSTIPLGNGLAVGETVHAITNPEGSSYYYSQGVVSRNTADHKIGPMGDRMEITADYAKGSSGGPIMDNKGNMQGMVSTTFSIYAQDRPQVNLQMVVKKTIPVRSIRSLMQLQ